MKPHTFTDTGLRDTLRTLRETREAMGRRAQRLQATIQASEIELTELNSIASAVGLVIDIFVAEQRRRDAIATTEKTNETHEGASGVR